MRILEEITSRIDRHNNLPARLFALDCPNYFHKPTGKKDACPTYHLNPGFIYVPAEPTLIVTRLGSGVSVCLFDRQNGIGGMNHFELPYTNGKDKATARYGDVALKTLLIMMQRAGTRISSLKAQIFGGAHNACYSTDNIGLKNSVMAREVLERKGIRVIGFDMGGEIGRHLKFNSATGNCSVSTVDRLPQASWYPYGNA